eukprot:CAMPEP_0170490626 /NCGR_PEP_ID=MMETSP0208-20121228/8773_1 /TAXON_ID=197538 /ORGANISM="Strombidium inclinatum, Strain S3" /LENGTH=61 /DNA_ID=CAMNT_0010766067 /DNA_START=195 /DNA_END=380 /DNA_ORIENTATION=-
MDPQPYERPQEPQLEGLEQNDLEAGGAPPNLEVEKYEYLGQLFQEPPQAGSGSYQNDADDD